MRLFSEALPAGADVARTNETGSENDSPARDLARFVAETARAYVPELGVRLVYRSDRFVRGGDQQSFAAGGFPAVRFVEARENYAHQHQDVRDEGGVRYGDLLAFVDFAYLASVTRANVAALATLALAPEPPRALLRGTLASDTTLRWDAVPGATTYEVVWRRTTDADWSAVRDVGNALEATLPVSKDDVVFGVRSVDAAGRRSVALPPIPDR